MNTPNTTKIAEIRKRVKEYHKHKNDPYAYFREEITAVRELYSHAVEDIEFLLAQLKVKITPKGY